MENSGFKGRQRHTHHTLNHCMMTEQKLDCK
jgi:hypothetical protein